MDPFLHDLAAFASSLVHGNRREVVLSIKILAVGAIIGVVFGTIVAIGQSCAIGLYPAWETYGGWWLVSPLIGAIFTITFIVVMIMFIGVILLIEHGYRAAFSDRARRVLSVFVRALAFVLAIGGVLGFFFFIGYIRARESNLLLAKSKLDNLSAVQVAVGGQTKALTDLSSAATNLLQQLDEMANDLQATRSNLAATLKTVESRIREGEHATQKVSVLIAQQQQIELRMRELQRLLDGGTPITKKDLESSGHTGLIIGAILGFAASLGAAFFYPWLVRFVRRLRGSGPNAA